MEAGTAAEKLGKVDEKLEEDSIMRRDDEFKVVRDPSL